MRKRQFGATAVASAVSCNTTTETRQPPRTGPGAGRWPGAAPRSSPGGENLGSCMPSGSTPVRGAHPTGRPASGDAHADAPRPTGGVAGASRDVGQRWSSRYGPLQGGIPAPHALGKGSWRETWQFLLTTIIRDIVREVSEQGHAQACPGWWRDSPHHTEAQDGEDA